MKTDFDRSLLDENPDALIVTTPEGIVVHWNKAAEVVFGGKVEFIISSKRDVTHLKASSRKAPSASKAKWSRAAPSRWFYRARWKR